MILTLHAEQRIAERTGASDECAIKAAEKALKNGLKVNETKGCVRKYLERRLSNHGGNKTIRLFGGFVYVFGGSKLITVYGLPPEYRQLARRIELAKRNTFRAKPKGVRQRSL